MKIKFIRQIGYLLMISALLLTGCTAKNDSGDMISDRDVLTLTPIPEDKIVLTMTTGDGMNIKKIIDAIEDKFPDVHIVVKHNTYPLLDIENNGLQDIILSNAPNPYREAPSGTYIDLSSYDFVSNYHLSALNNCELNGRLYYLPGPSTVTGIVYDKELFEKHGWKPAESLDEFIDLCRKIDATGIRAIQPTLKFGSAARLFYAGFTYADTFAGIKGLHWLNDYKRGKTNMVGYMEKGFKTMETLLDAGIWKSEDFDVAPIQRSEMLYKDHTTAMILETQMAPYYAKEIGEGNEHEIAMMPFFSGNEDGDDYLIADPNFFIGVNSRLQEKGNEEKLERAIDILRYISSVEGQKAIISEETPLISNVIGVELQQKGFLSGVEKTIEEGRVVNTPYYWGSLNSDIDVVFAEKLRQFGEGKVTVNALLAACDEARDNILTNSGKDGNVIGNASEDFTVMEAALYFADAFRQKSNAQIGLCLANTRNLGINTKIYKGPIYAESVISLGAFLEKYIIPDEHGVTLKLVSMSGKNIKKALQDTINSRKEYEDSYLTASGLKIEFAPWASQDKNIVRVTLEDGSELKDNEIYRVAVWSNVLDPDLITETEKIYTDDIISIFKESIEKNGGSIQPFADDRFILNWDIR